MLSLSTQIWCRYDARPSLRTLSALSVSEAELPTLDLAVFVLPFAVPVSEAILSVVILTGHLILPSYCGSEAKDLQ